VRARDEDGSGAGDELELDLVVGGEREVKAANHVVAAEREREDWLLEVLLVLVALGAEGNEVSLVVDGRGAEDSRLDDKRVAHEVSVVLVLQLEEIGRDPLFDWLVLVQFADPKEFLSGGAHFLD